MFPRVLGSIRVHNNMWVNSTRVLSCCGKRLGPEKVFSTFYNHLKMLMNNTLSFNIVWLSNSLSYSFYIAPKSRTKILLMPGWSKWIHQALLWKATCKSNCKRRLIVAIFADQISNLVIHLHQGRNVSSSWLCHWSNWNPEEMYTNGAKAKKG